jgi:hypothetical protein
MNRSGAAQSSGEGEMRKSVVWGMAAAAGLWAAVAAACGPSPASLAALGTPATKATAAEQQPPSLKGTSGFAAAQNRNATLTYGAGGNAPSLSVATLGPDQTTAARHDENPLQK